MSKPPARPGNPAYFDPSKKGEVNELKMLLQSVMSDRDTKKKRDVIKKVIAYMTLGIDVSRLFSEMVLAVNTSDIVIKKMVFQYLTQHAHSHPDIAILCINTLKTDCSANEDPMIRGLALRSLCSLRLESMLEYLLEPLQACLRDVSPYVRKTAVMGVLKVYTLSPETVKESDFIDQLYTMIKDKDASVVTNCLMALNEIMADEGGMATNQQIIQYLLNRVLDFNEWGQCTVLALCAKYEPVDQNEVYAIMNILEQCLRMSNSAIVLATTKCFLNFTENMPEVHREVYNRLKTPLLTLMSTGNSPELCYCVLAHILLLAQREPGVFQDEYKQFYTKYNEPSHVKYLKVEIMGLVSNGANVEELVNELSEYVGDVDIELARHSVRSIAQIAIKNPQGSGPVVDQILEFVEMPEESVRSEAAIALKDILRKYPQARFDVLPHIENCLKQIESAEGKAAVIWIIGEFGADIKQAPYLIEPLLDDVSEESDQRVVLELLSSSMKLFFKRPPEMQYMLGRLLQTVLNDLTNVDLRDRAMLYYRMLQTDPNSASVIMQGTSITANDQGIQEFAEEADNDVKEKMFQEFNSLSVVYRQTSEQFISEEHQVVDGDVLDDDMMDDVMDDDAGYDEDGYNDNADSYEPEMPAGNYAEPAVPQQQQQIAQPNILDMDFDAGPSVSMINASLPQLRPSPSVDSATFQNLWGTLGVFETLNERLCDLPAQADIERCLAGANIATMASGDVGTEYKFFFYGQGQAGSTFLCEALVNKAALSLTATIKCDQQEQVPSAFTNAIKSGLAAYLA